MAALAQWTNVGVIDNSVNEMEVHIQQTNDRLQCIRQVTSTPSLAGRRTDNFTNILQHFTCSFKFRSRFQPQSVMNE